MLDKYKSSVVYQVYVKSFCDSNGDGIGDLNGIRSKLPYIKSLGVKYIWLTPFFCSPMIDNGYDVSDYRNINPMFGTMEDCEALIREADALGIGLMFDMVFNHTSDKHEWFKKALTGDPEYMDYYIFRDEKPQNWTASFGTPAWEYVPSLGKWYLHLFATEQPDLNWENPKVREELKNVIRFWKDKGVKGFRFDVLNLISKPADFTGLPDGSAHKFCKDGRHVHEFIRELITDTGTQDMITVGEMSSTTIDNVIRYSNPKSHELSMCFSFHHMKVDYLNGNKFALMPPDMKMLHDVFKDWQEKVADGGGWNAVFWCNHDQPRVVSRFGDEGQYWKESAKMLGTFVHLLRGTPYIYQGEELGMTNAHYTSIDQYDDVEAINYYKILLQDGSTESEALNVLANRARDNSRTPMQWNDGKFAGFSDSGAWLGIPENYRTINVEAEEEDADSILNYYRELVKLRSERRIIAEGTIKFLETGNDRVLAYERELDGERLVVVCSFSGNEESVPVALDGEVLIGNYPDRAEVLRPYEAVAVMK